MGARLAEIERDVTYLFGEFKPTQVGIEFPFFDREKTSQAKVLSALGVLSLVCDRHLVIPSLLGLGGWCILGKQKRWLPVFWETIVKVVPIIALTGVKRIHIFGCTWYKPIQGFQPPIPALLALCDNYGIELSVDGRSPIGNALWKNTWKQAGATFPYWRHNLAWVKAELATLRDSPWYQLPLGCKKNRLFQ